MWKTTFWVYCMLSTPSCLPFLFSVSLSGSHGLITYLKRRSSCSSLWRQASFRTWPAVSAVQDAETALSRLFLLHSAHLGLLQHLMDLKRQKQGSGGQIPQQRAALALLIHVGRSRRPGFLCLYISLSLQEQTQPRWHIASNCLLSCKYSIQLMG